MYAIIVCYKCGRLLLTKAIQRTKACPYCKSRLEVERAKKVATARTAREASALIRSLKSQPS